MNNFLKNKKVLLIVTGGIASYKSIDVLRRLQDNKADVECILTESAKEFVNIITFESLLGKKVHSNLFSLSEEKEMNHIKLANQIDVILVVPSTANFIAKMANGIADDLASNIILASKKTKIIAPAMNTNMWNNEAVKKNLTTLEKMNVRIFSPKKGTLACGQKGTGKLMDTEEIVENLNDIFSPKELSGLKIIVTAGASIEQIDTVRFISNNSSGIQGYEIAKSLSSLGAEIILITGKTGLKKPKKVKKIEALSGINFYDRIIQNCPCDVLISAAAISDWKVKNKTNKKIKKANKNEIKISFVKNIDVLTNISRHKKRPKLIIGFSAETSNLIKNSKLKLKEKNCDWIIANDVSGGSVFGSENNKVTFISKNEIENWPHMKKAQVAKKISKKIVNFFKKK